MIHSLAGGNLGNVRYLDFVKVEILDSPFSGGIYWYTTKLKDLEPKDIVLVPLESKQLKAKVLRVDKNVSSFASPVPVNRAKSIIKKINV